MNYISIGIIILAAFIASVIITKAEIPVLRRKAGQNIREEGPESHFSKAGTPSMGGISIIIGACAAALIAATVYGTDISELLIILFVFI